MYTARNGPTHANVAMGLAGVDKNRACYQLDFSSAVLTASGPLLTTSVKLMACAAEVGSFCSSLGFSTANLRSSSCNVEGMLESTGA